MIKRKKGKTRAGIPIGNPNVRLEAALKRYRFDRKAKSKGLSVPDYVGFTKWFAKECGETQTAILPDDPGFDKTVLGVATLKFAQLADEMNRHRQDRASPSLTLFHEFKLLGRIFGLADGPTSRGDSIASQLMGARKSKPNACEDVDLDDLHKLPSVQLRQRFFQSIRNADERLASAILGMLTTRKEEHDEGELSYLRSFYEFRSSRYTSAIKEARKVAQDCIDFPNAQRIILESLAAQGDADGIANFVQNPESDKYFTPAFWLMLAHKLLLKLECIPENLASFLQGRISPIKVSDPNYAKYALTIGASAVECMSLYHDVSQASNAERQTTSINEDDTDPIASLFDSLPQRSPKLVSLIRSLALDPEFADYFSEDRISEYVLRRVWSFADNETPTFEHIELVLMTQFEAHLYRMMVDNFINISPILRTFSDKRLPQLLTTVRIASALSEDEATIVAASACIESNFEHKFPSDIGQTVAIRKRSEGLTHMGAHAYRQAIEMLRQMEERQEAWVDAGPVSLALFRILELELNFRLVRPAFSDPAKLAYLDSAVDELLKIAPQSKKLESAQGFWTRMRGRVAAVGSGKISGLELGDLEALLAKASKIAGPDSEIKQVVSDAISKYLTPAGLDSLQTGAMVELISSKHREEFRNPPAHTRYLPLPVAADCRSHVDRALDLMQSWLVPLRAVTNQS